MRETSMNWVGCGATVAQVDRLTGHVREFFFSVDASGNRVLVSTSLGALRQSRGDWCGRRIPLSALLAGNASRSDRFHPQETVKRLQAAIRLDTFLIY